MMPLKKNALVIGSKGAIGSAIVSQLQQDYRVHTISRENCDYSEASLQKHRSRLLEEGHFSMIVCTVGTLHDDTVKPEKSVKQVSHDSLAHYFHVNSVLPMLCIKHFHHLLDKQSSSRFACLSAMVGSTQDNQLGGWYGYRASKAALNSLVKTSAIELSRTFKHACLIAIHPGTTIGDLSAPYAKNIATQKYYTPEQSAKRIVRVMESKNASHSGDFYNWDGNAIPW
ncbi:MAG: SDR family NAD(P)-dependent oxidoreductase [Arenicella sp.]